MKFLFGTSLVNMSTILPCAKLLYFDNRLIRQKVVPRIIMFAPPMINLTLCQTNGTQVVTDYYSMLTPENLNPIFVQGSTLRHLHDKAKCTHKK